MTIRIEDYIGLYSYRNETNYEKFVFEKVLGKDFGNIEIVLEPKSVLFLKLITDLGFKIQKLLETQRKIPDPNTKYNDRVNMFGETYFVNRRKEEDTTLEHLYRFYKNLKQFYDYGYPLYLTPAREEDIKKYWGNFKAGDSYEPIFQQK